MVEAGYLLKKSGKTPTAAAAGGYGTTSTSTSTTTTTTTSIGRVATSGGRGGVTEYCQTAILEHNQMQHQFGGSMRRNLSHNSSEQQQSPHQRRLSSEAASSSSPAANNNITNRSSSRGTSNNLRLMTTRRIASVPSLLELNNNNANNNNNNAGSSSMNQLLLPEEYEVAAPDRNTIRFQVIVWHIGQIDMIQSRVPATFRVTIFWNAPPDHDDDDAAGTDLDDDAPDTASVSVGSSSRRNLSWKMDGRQRAVQTQETSDGVPSLNVPAIAILNVVTFETVGEPQVSLLREDTRLMRWSCMYRAVLFQDHWEVYNFPHDDHDISIRLAILADRSTGATWDRHVWKLGLATASDSAGSIRVPHGVLVDHVKIPEFQYNQHQGLQFGLHRLKHGPGGLATKDTCLEIKLKVWRNSSYYDRNIMPLLGMLNLVAITVTALEAHRFFERALLTLNITFVEIGMRMTADSKLPTASYQIKMQRILNEYFLGLLSLVLESLLVYELNEYGFAYTGYIDALAALLVFTHNAYSLTIYYADAERVRREVEAAAAAPVYLQNDGPTAKLIQKSELGV